MCQIGNGQILDCDTESLMRKSRPGYLDIFTLEFSAAACIGQ